MGNWENAQNHLDIAIVRHLYVSLLSLLLSYVLFTFYRSAAFQAIKHPLFAMAGVSIIAALITAVVVNPITYLMIGYNIHSIPDKLISTGSLYFALFYFIWSLLITRYPPAINVYTTLVTDKTDSETKQQNLTNISVTLIHFNVEKMGKQLRLPATDIVYINAQADYVELNTMDTTFLLKETMTALEKKLTGNFVRVHRSTLINKAFVEAVEKRPGGLHSLKLTNGQSINVSRTYMLNISAILPEKLPTN
jgi:DNA-binding LytR/AlgR family response regulator